MMRLMYTNDKGKFHIDLEAVALLQLVKDPVGVVSVCDRTQQGQISILNQSTCWAMAKSWLDVQVDIKVASLRPGGINQLKSFEEAIERSPGQGDLSSQPSGGPH